MNDNLCLFVTGKTDTILEVLKKIDRKKKGVLIVTDVDSVVLGIVTDSDIRCGFINGAAVTDTIAEVYTKNHTFLSS